jgi:hypothetical protein
MTTPNIVSVATINPFTLVGDLTTSDADLVDVTAEYCFKVESIFLCNADPSNSCTAALKVSIDNGSNWYYLCNALVIPPATTISIIDRPLFLDETDLIRGSASANGDIDYVISGTKIVD